MSEFTKEVIFYPAFDNRDPDPKKDYGLHGVEIRFVLKGEKGAMTFAIYTDWDLPHVQKERSGRSQAVGLYGIKPMGVDIGYHSLKPIYDEQPISQKECQYLDGKPCYYDGSGIQAEDFVPKFLAGGSEAVWNMLEGRYREMFGE